MKTQKTLGRVSAKLISTLYDKNKAIFNIGDVINILGKNYNETTDLLSELVKRKIITRLKAGKYLIIPQEMGNVEEYIGNWYIAGREVTNSHNYYIAFYSAMHFWGMLTQPISIIYVATPKRQNVPKDMKNKIIFVFIDKKFIWGISEEWVTNSEKVRISNLEKTIIDAVGHPQYCGGVTEIAKGISIVKDKIDYDKLKNYVIKYNKNVAAKRLGYILEILEINQLTILDQLRKFVSDRYDLFDPSLSKKISDKNDWRLIDNVGRKQIHDLIWH